MKYNYLYILLLVCLGILIVPPVSGVAQLVWSIPAFGCVTAVDTNSDGSKIFVGTADGCITAYDTTGNMTWYFQTNDTHTPRGIKKLVSTSNGEVVWINEAHQAGYINSDGTVTGMSNRSGNINITDVSVRSDGSMWVTSELTPPRLAIFDPYGVVLAYNETITMKNWTKIGYDPLNTWLLSANLTDNKTYFWNIDTWNGWSQFNPAKTGSKNVSQIQVDRFPYKQNLNITGLTNRSSLIFHNTTNTTSIQKINNSYFEYNRINTGTYFWWAPAGTLLNMSNTTTANQTYMLGLSYISGDDYRVVLQNRTGNFTIYYGDPTYTFDYGTWVANGTNITLNYTAGTYSWTSPISTLNVSAFIVGSGGHGGNADSSWGGGGGGAGATTSVYLPPDGTTYTIVVGYTGTSYSAGQASSIGAYSAGGGALGTIGNSSSRSGLAGAAGYQGISPYINGTTPLPGVYEYWTGAACAANYYYSPGGGQGYGGGGGGGNSGGNDGICGGGGISASGAGAAGIVRITYIVIERYPVLSELSGSYSRDTGVSLNQSSTKQYVGSVVGMDVPLDGGIATIITAPDDPDITLNGGFYRQAVTSAGFGSYQVGYYGATYGPFSGIPLAVKTSNTAAYTIEARGVAGYIYDYGGAAKAQISTGGTMRSVDIGSTSGILAAYGGDEGRVGIVSREGSTTWYTYYTGAVGTVVNSVAVTPDGFYVVAGRQGATIELYSTNVSIPVTPTTSYVEANVRVYKDGAEYPGQTITVFSSTNPTDSSWAPVGTLYTDTHGHGAFTTTSGTYYKFVVNVVGGTTEGEGSVIWQSNSGSTVVNIYILTPSTPYEWNAYYSESTNNVTVVYSDSIVPSSVTITIRDLKTNNLVLSKTYTGTQSFTVEYNDQLQNGSYQVTAVMNRLGTSVRDQRMVMRPNTYNISMPVDQNIVYAVFTIILMIIAGLFSYIDSKRGAFAVVIIAVVFIYFGFLPAGLLTIAMLAAIFAVMSLFASRV